LVGRRDLLGAPALRAWWAAALAAGLVVAGQLARAEDTATQAVAGAASQRGVDAALQAAIDQLDSANFKTREKATLALWAAGPAVLPMLRGAAQGGSAERKARLAAVINDLSLGLLPSTPAEVTALVRAYQAAKPEQRRTVAYELLELGYKADRVIAQLAATDASPEMRAYLADGLADRMGMRAQGAILAGDVAGAQAIVADAYRTGNVDAMRDAAALAYQTSTLPALIDHLNVVPPNETVELRQNRTLERALALWNGGDHAGAMAALRVKGATQEFHWQLAAWETAEGEWEELTQEMIGRTAVPLPADGTRNLQEYFPLLYAQFSGADVDPKWKVPELGLLRPAERAKLIVALHGLDADGVDRITHESPDIAYDLLVQAGRYEEALALVERDPNNLRLPAVQLRVRLGQRVQAEQVVMHDWVDGPGHAVDPIVRARGLIALGKPGDAFKLVAGALQKGQATLDAVLAALFPDGDAARFWYVTWMHQLHDARAALEATANTLAGKASADELRRVLPGIKRAIVADANPALFAPEPEVINLVNGLLENHLTDEAIDCLKTLPTNAGSFDVIMRAATVERQAGKWKEANELYDLALAPDPVDPNPLARKADGLEHLGDHAGAAALLRTAELIPLVEDDRRSDLIDAGGALGRADLIERQTDIFMVVDAYDPLTMEPWFAWRLMHRAQGDTTAWRLRLGQRMVLMSLIGTVDDLLTARRWCDAMMAESLMEKGDEAGALGLAARVGADGVSNEPVGELVRAFAAAGHGGAAEKLYADRVAAQEKLLTDDPDAGEIHAALAGLMIDHHGDLAAATVHAQRAADLRPEDGVGFYLLARAAAEKGDRVGALGLARRAAEKSPEDAGVEVLLRGLEMARE
jgi:tetratricopeptide (TPR) repeat protein